jgi:hypothetical protein
MYIKPYFKNNKSTGERYTVYKLVEGYRINKQVTHRIIISFGRLEELETDDEKKLLGKRVEELLINGGNTLSISQIDERIEQMAHSYYQEIRKQKRFNTKRGNRDWETVYIFQSY